MVGSTADAKPPSHDLLKADELDEVVRDPQEKVVASYDLKPFELACSDFQEREHIAGDVLIDGRPVRMRKVNRRVPDLQHSLPSARGAAQGLVCPGELVHAQVSCMQELVASTDLAALFAATKYEEFEAQFFACLEDQPQEEVPENKFDLYPDSLWQEAFDAFSASEQMCIRNNWVEVSSKQTTGRRGA